VCSTVRTSGEGSGDKAFLIVYGAVQITQRRKSRY
jgi:hypothetical protein